MSPTGHIVSVFHTVGYDSNHASDFYNTLLRLLPPGTKATTSLYSTHPGTKDRIKRLQAAALKDKLAGGRQFRTSRLGGAEGRFSDPHAFRLDLGPRWRSPDV